MKNLNSVHVIFCALFILLGSALYIQLNAMENMPGRYSSPAPEVQYSLKVKIQNATKHSFELALEDGNTIELMPSGNNGDMYKYQTENSSLIKNHAAFNPNIKIESKNSNKYIELNFTVMPEDSISSLDNNALEISSGNYPKYLDNNSIALSFKSMNKRESVYLSEKLSHPYLVSCAAELNIYIMKTPEQL